MTVVLLPRLSRLGVKRLMAELGDDYSSDEATSFLNDHASLSSFAASGGVRERRTAEEIARTIRQVAVECGFPSSSGQTGRAKFDRDAAIALMSFGALATGEGLRDDVWAYLAAVLLPELVRWRFENASHERFGGGVRNTFQRLYMRASALDLGSDVGVNRWRLLRALTEDAHVAIFERPSIGGNPTLARAVALGWAHAAARQTKGEMEGVMRRAIKLLRLRHQIVDLGVLEDHELAEVVVSIFEDAAGSMEQVA